MLSKILHSESEDFNHYSKFQNRVVQEWNPSSAKATAFIIPPVSLRDEIKTDGYGMAMIELLCLSGILLKSKRDINSAVDNTSWTLSENWWKKTLYLCMDGLSLDRHRSFQRKWCVGMFKDDIPDRECIVKDGYTIINALKTKFKQGDIVTKTDELELCINGMFKERDNTINVPVEDDSGTNDSECNDSEAVEIMIDDYTGHEAIDSSDANTDDINHTIKDKNHRSIPKLSLKDVFAEGRLKMIEMNIPSMRERKKLREQRTNAFFLEIHDTVTQSNDNTIDELDSIHNDILFNPWYRMSYRLALG